MQYQENYRKARQFLNQRQQQIDFQPYKLNQPQITTIRQILEVIRSKERSNSQFKYMKTIGQEKQEDNHQPQILISSNFESKDHNQSLAAKLLRLNKITRNKTQVTPYNFIDRIIEPLKKKTDIQSEQNSPLRIRKNIPCIEYQLPTQLIFQDNQKQLNNLSERKFCIQKSRLKEISNSQQTKNNSIQNCLSHHQIINKEQPSPTTLRKLNKTSYQTEKIKIINSTQNEKIEKQIQLIRQVSGWTIQSQESVQTLF